MSISQVRFFSLIVALALSATQIIAFSPGSGDLTRANPDQVRLVAWNTHRNFISVSSLDDEYQRIFTVLDPDIIALEEMAATLTANEIQTRLDTIIPLGGGAHWSVNLGLSDGTYRNVLASRYPQSLQITDTTPASELRGVTGALVDLPDARFATDFYVMAVHLKCCSGATETSRRQQHCDALAKWFGDIRTSGGDIDLPSNTPAVVMGDFNLVDPDPQQPEVTLRTGDITDNVTYGPDIKGDWDVTDITDLQPADPYTSNKSTFSTSTGSTYYMSSRLDRFYYTDNAVTVANSFVLFTPSMSTAQLSAAGLLSGDSAAASDHCPIVADFAVTTVPVEVSAFSIE